MLTECQDRVIKTGRRFLAGDKYMFLGIQGAGGVGKTYAVSSIIAKMDETNNIIKMLGGAPIETVIVAAPTYKALEVFVAAMGEIPDNLSLVPCTTTALPNMLSKCINNDDSTLVVITEGSMVGEKTYVKLAELFRTYRELSNVKFIVEGDKFQLAPIKDNPVFMEENFVKCNIIEEMVTPVRNTKPDMLQQLNLVRKCIEDNIPIQLNPGPNMVVLPPGKFTQMAKDGSFDPTKDCYVGATNHDVVNTQSGYRGLFNLPSYPVKDDVITAMNNIKKNKNSHNIINGKDYRVINTFVNDTAMIAVGEAAVPMYRIEVEDNYGQTKSFYTPVNPAELDRATRSLPYFAKSRIFNEGILSFRLRGFSTIHKAQGSTYRDVYLNLSALNRSSFVKDLDTYNRLVYTALSRAEGKVYLITE